MEDVWQIMTRSLFITHCAFNVKIHAFVLMKNHFHMMLSTPEANLSKAMQFFMRSTSRDLTRAGNRINQTYGARYFRCLLTSQHYYLHAYKYIYQNPVKAGMSETVESYPFSTLNGLLGFSRLPVPLVDDGQLFDRTEETLSWLNAKPSAPDWTAVGLALRRQRFKLALSENGSASHLEYLSL
jgi:putative transposase